MFLEFPTVVLHPLHKRMVVMSTSIPLKFQYDRCLGHGIRYWLDWIVTERSPVISNKNHLLCIIFNSWRIGKNNSRVTPSVLPCLKWQFPIVTRRQTEASIEYRHQKMRPICDCYKANRYLQKSVHDSYMCFLAFPVNFVTVK